MYGRGPRPLQIVTPITLRRGESSAFSFGHGARGGSGRTAICPAPSVPRQFAPVGSRESSITRVWLEAMAAASPSTAGFRLIAEPPRGIGVRLDSERSERLYLSSPESARDPGSAFQKVFSWDNNGSSTNRSSPWFRGVEWHSRRQYRHPAAVAQRPRGHTADRRQLIGPS